MPLSSVSLDDTLVVTWSVRAPAESVWSVLTDATRQSQWLGAVLESEPRPGGTLVVDHGDGYLCRSSIIELEAPRRLLMTWEFPDEPRSRVAITLDETADEVLVELVHAGLGDLADSYAAGWMTHLTYLEAAVHGSPVPWSQFWMLHATITALYDAQSPSLP
ncbi:SRPBCC domain-containing protein [Nocardioides currus]|uniref:Activator of Hsp90 ATPase homologue 1/2-like C-terminal domain-containing protein n=1 Tax=Nocardioides currus TaxID=2133958 RepID=A0A2R7YSP6_9ACTN|nr:SRPBCC domain-containing protein [Nocardioides currus]PUA79274.1 hypothetical protein C7S10_19795 [Nocardioides currus]